MAERPDGGPVQPTVSPDGKFVWDGHNWVPNPSAPAPSWPSYQPSAPEAPAPAVPAMPAARKQYSMPERVNLQPGTAKLPASNTTRNIAALVVVAAILFVGGCLAIVGGAVGSFQQQAEGPELLLPGGGFDSTGITKVVEEGERFGILFLRFQPGWRIATEDEVGHVTVLGLTVENQRDANARADLLFHLMRGKQEVGKVHCRSERLTRGATGDLTCTSADSFDRTYTRIRVESLR